MNLKEAVQLKIAGFDKRVADMAAEEIARQTLDKRVSLVVSAFTLMDNLEKEANKIKPDLNSLSENGDLVAAHYSKDQYEKRKKIRDRHRKIGNCLEAALGDPSKYNELANVIGVPTT